MGCRQSAVKQCMSKHSTIAVAGMPESMHLRYKMNGEAAAVQGLGVFKSFRIFRA